MLKVARASSRQRHTCRPGAERSLAALKFTQRVEGGGDIVELLVEKVGVGMRGHGDRSVAHRLLKQAKVGSGPPRQRCIGVPQIMVKPTSA